MTSVYESLLSDYPDKGVIGKPEVLKLILNFKKIEKKKKFSSILHLKHTFFSN